MADDNFAKSAGFLDAFRERIELLGIWSSAWLGVAAVRGDGPFQLFYLRAILETPGARLPDPALAVDATTTNGFVRCRRISLADLWQLLSGITREDVSALVALIDHEVALPAAFRASNWFSHPSASYSPEGRQLRLSTRANVEVYKLMGHDLFEALKPQLRNLHAPYTSLSDIASAMEFDSGTASDNNTVTPALEITAEVPLRLEAASYKRAKGGIEIEVRAGRSVPLQRVRVAVVAHNRQSFTADTFQVREDHGYLYLSQVVATPELKRDGMATLQFEEIAFGEQKISKPEEPQQYYFDQPAEAEWASEMVRDFGLSVDEVRASLRQLVPATAGAALDEAEARILAAVNLRRDHPFFSVVAAASVAEFALKERLRRVKVNKLAEAWKNLNAGKFPRPENRWGNGINFDRAIKVAEYLGLLDQADRASIDLLREARNHVHIDRNTPPRKGDFVPARATSAVLATLDLFRKAHENRRVRSRKRPRATP